MYNPHAWKYKLLRLAQAGYYRRFRRAAAQLQHTQTRILLHTLHVNQHTQIGEKYGFAHIKNYADYAARVPVQDYDNLLPAIESTMQGAPHVLTSEKVRYMAISSGTSAASKYIPYTAGLLGEFQHATGAWLYNLYTERKALSLGKAFWIITPPVSNHQPDAVIPIGFDDDSGYFDGFSRRLIQSIMAVPDVLAHCTHYPDYLLLLCFFLLSADDIVLISVWNPSLLLVIKELIIKHKELLTTCMAAGSIAQHIEHVPQVYAYLQKHIKPQPARASRIAQILGEPNPAIHLLWPRLGLISCWTDGWAASYIPEINTMFPGVEIQGKGLLATEGVVSFPLLHEGGCSHVLAANAHFYEFACTETGSIHPAWELQPGKQYEVLLTTLGGLYRYPLHDVVEVTGFHMQLPVLHFAGKSNISCDLTGEKLNVLFVERALPLIWLARELEVQHWFLAPATSLCGYVLYVYAPYTDAKKLGQLAESLDQALMQNFHYSHARNLQQLQALRVYMLSRQGWCSYHQQVLDNNKLSTAKLSHLHKTPGWEHSLEGSFIA